MRCREGSPLLVGRAIITFLFLAHCASAELFSNTSTAIRNSTSAISSKTSLTSLSSNTASSTSTGIRNSTSAISSKTSLTSLSASFTSTGIRNSTSAISNNTPPSSLSTNSTSLTSAKVSLSNPQNTSPPVPTITPGVNTTRSNALSVPSTSSGTQSHLSSNNTGSIPFSSGSSTLLTRPSGVAGNGTGHGNSSDPDPAGAPTDVGVIGILTTVIVQSGATVTKEIITGESFSGPITLAPVTTTYASSEATSAVSSVSSQLVAMIPFILAWEKNPIPDLKTDALNNINGVEGAVLGLIASLGTTPSSSPCNSKKKRGLLGIISSIVNTLTCIGGELSKVTGKITGGIVDGIEPIVSTIEAKLDELEDEEDEEDEESQSGGSSTATKSSQGSCTSTRTAFQVTKFCGPTVYTTDGSAVTTSTCSSTATLTITGCTASGSTATVSGSTSEGPTQTQCAPDTCGDSCVLPRPPGDGKPLGQTPVDCKTFPTVTVSDEDAVSTDSYKRDLDVRGNPYPYNETMMSLNDPRHPLFTRVLPDVGDVNETYVESLADDATILPLRMTGNVWTDGGFYRHPETGSEAFGLVALTGCTAVIIASNKGVYVAHIWENFGFMVPNGDQRATQHRTHAEFRTLVTDPLRRGNADVESIRNLVGTDNHPGRLHRTHQPKIFVITPFTTDYDKYYANPPITTTYCHDDLARYLLQKLSEIIPGARTQIAGYTRDRDVDVDGMVFFEVDREQRWERRGGGQSDRQIGRWKVWAGPDLLDWHDFRVTHRRRRGHKRELGIEDGSGNKRQAPSTAPDDEDFDGEGEEDDVPNPCPGGVIPPTSDNTTSSIFNNNGTVISTSSVGTASKSAMSSLSISTSISSSSINNTVSASLVSSVASTTKTLPSSTGTSSNSFNNTDSASSTSVLSSTKISLTSASATTTYSQLPCSNWADPHVEPTGTDYCTCNNGASTAVAPATGSNTGSNYQPCPYTVAPPLPPTPTPTTNTNPFPFTTTLLGGQVEACETSTFMYVAGYKLTQCAGSITTLVSTTATTTSATLTATPSTTLGDVTCYSLADNVSPVVGPNYPFPDSLGTTSINYFCQSGGPKYESNPKYSGGWPNSPGYAGDWFFFDGTNEGFCGSSPIDGTDNGWWSTDTNCQGGDKSQLKIWVDVAFSADQTGCSPEKTWDIPKGQSCTDIYSTLLNCKSDHLVATSTYGGVLKQKTANGCVDWRIWSTNGDNMGPP